MAHDLTTQTPVEIDTVLAANYDAQARQEAHLAAAARNLARAEKSKYTTPADLDRLAGILTKGQAELRDLIAESTPYHAEFSRRGGWNRYYLVTNANGHVHRELHCTTCFRTTQYNWIVDLADCNEDAMIEEWGERACTVCFPTAPVNPNYNRPARIDREAQEARAAEKAARDAVKAAKGIVDIDGSPLKDAHGYTLKTKVAARNELSSCFNSLVYYGLGHPQDFAATIRRLAPALVAADIDIVKVATNAIKRAVKESEIPAHNPYRLSDEQIAQAKAEHAVNLAQAQALLAELKEDLA